MVLSRTFRTRATALCATSVLLFTACGTTETPAEPSAPPSTEPPAELAQFYGQQLEFGPCVEYARVAADRALYDDDRFDCARVDVPLDYAEPDGARGQVALLRAKARGDKIGSLLVNPGGPGGSGMNLVASLKAAWDATPVGERFDVIGFDPRGVGASTPRVECYTDAERDAGQGIYASAFQFTDPQDAQDLAQRCTEGSGGAEALTSVGSSNVVRDMDVMRAVLGDEKLTYLGYSYGSELGAMYAEAFPQNLRAMVIDGAVDPELTEAEFRMTQYAASQRAFEQMAAECAATADCPLGSDPARATETFQDLVRPLQDQPAPAGDGRVLTFDDAVQTVSMALMTKSLWPAIQSGLSELRDGRGDGLLAFRDILFGRGADGAYGGALHVDANIAIRCMDNPRRSVEQQTEQLRQYQSLAPVLSSGRPVQSVHYECEAWPEPVSRSLPWLTDSVEVPPTLVVSVTGDPGTPHQGGINMARKLGGSLLTVEGAQHGVVFMGGDACVDGIAADYLIDLQTPQDDARCELAT